MNDIDLRRLLVLFLDCQATGANPRTGEVIEIAWVRSDSLRAADPDSANVNSYFLRLPPGREIPNRVQAITGIGSAEVEAGYEPKDVWHVLRAEAEEIARVNRAEKCPLIIHFARFEAPFLIDLHAQHSDGTPFPFKILCTHVIAKRLFPELPRRSLRAMAGYFDHSLGSIRRSSDHVLATAIVWQKMVGVLREQYGITTFDQLQQWLAQPMVVRRTERIYPMAAELRRNISDKPGVYRMYRSNGDVLYVGKATSLRQRINSYFQKSMRHREHILEMLSQAKQLDVTETETTIEAAILESDEIKRLSPPYNIALRRSERDVWFCSADFSEFSKEPNKQCRLGPIIAQEPVKRLAQIMKMVRNQAADDEFLAALGIPANYAPDMSCIKQGWGRFVSGHAKFLNSHDTGRALTELGKELWLERQAEKASEDEESDEFELESVKIPVWTPDSVCRMLEANVARGVYEIRRARWLVLLSESALAWTENGGQYADRYLLVFEKGQILFRRKIKSDDIPVPPGHARSFEEKQRSFDLMTFDRMRVVTTEIRKIVANMGWVKLRLSPDNILGSEALLKVFKWV